jgi:hypothetical protein
VQRVVDQHHEVRHLALGLQRVQLIPDPALEQGAAALRQLNALAPLPWESATPAFTR